MANVAIIDYGGSNLRSVVRAVEAVAERSVSIAVTDDHRVIRDAGHVIFPGQGAIGNCMERLAARGLIDDIRDTVTRVPFLGICLGLQSLVDNSDEDGGTPCLGLYRGGVRRFPENPPPAADGTPQKVPHMGWNEVRWSRPHPLLEGIDDHARFYFVHSYHVEPDNPELRIGITDYIEPFTAALADQNVFATQFHPEKSAAAGLRLLRNFIHWDGQS